MQKSKDPFMTGFKTGVAAGIVIGMVLIHLLFTWLVQRAA